MVSTSDRFHFKVYFDGCIWVTGKSALESIAKVYDTREMYLWIMINKQKHKIDTSMSHGFAADF